MTDSKRKRIRERIAETTAKARENFVPVDSGPDPRLHRHEVGHAVHVQKEAAAGSFEKAFDYEDPNSERFLPEGMDGVIQIKTRSEVESEIAYEKALKDPKSVLGPRVRYEDVADEQSPKRGLTMVDAGHRLARQQITEAHDPKRLERVRKGLSVGEDGSDPDLGGPDETDEILAREATNPHAESLGCAGCGGLTYAGSTVISKSGKIYCHKCKDTANLDD